MKVIQEIIEVKETYVADDGRKFKSKLRKSKQKISPSG